MLSTLTPQETKARRQLDELRERLAHDQAPAFADRSPAGVKKRWTETRGDVSAWSRLYAEHHVGSPDAAFHRDIDAMFAWPRLEVHGMHGPRDHAKSTRCMLNILEGLTSGSLRYWAFISETLGLAIDRAEMINIELKENARLRQDYDHQVPQERRVEGDLGVPDHAQGDGAGPHHPRHLGVVQDAHQGQALAREAAVRRVHRRLREHRVQPQPLDLAPQGGLGHHRGLPGLPQDHRLGRQHRAEDVGPLPVRAPGLRREGRRPQSLPKGRHDPGLCRYRCETLAAPRTATERV